VLGYDAQGNLVGIAIDIDNDNAATNVSFEFLFVSSLPGSIETDAG
jgi:hypothetical protein